MDDQTTRQPFAGIDEADPEVAGDDAAGGADGGGKVDTLGSATMPQSSVGSAPQPGIPMGGSDDVTEGDDTPAAEVQQLAAYDRGTTGSMPRGQAGGALPEAAFHPDGPLDAGDGRDELPEHERR